MAEENQVPQEPQQVMKEPQQVKQVAKEPQGKAKQVQRVTTKNPKKVEAGKRLAEHNRKKREEQRKEQAKLEKTSSGVSQYYGTGAVIALGVISGLGYYIYRTKKGEVPNRTLQASTPWNPPQQPCRQVQLQTNKFEMD